LADNGKVLSFNLGEKMALHFTQRKVLNVHWDTSVVKGLSVSIEAAAVEGDPHKEVRNTANDGYAVLSYPANFEGESHIVVKGSRSGEESGSVTIK
jgi:hypothetical protein